MGRKILVLGVLFLTILAPNSSAAGDAGVDVNPKGDEPFTVIERSTPSVDKETWSLTIEMKQEAYDNGTTFQIVTQICTNDGVCDPPVTMDAEITERLHSISLSPPNDHSYVNWRVKQPTLMETIPITHMEIGSQHGLHAGIQMALGAELIR